MTTTKHTATINNTTHNFELKVGSRHTCQLFEVAGSLGQLYTVRIKAVRGNAECSMPSQGELVWVFAGTHFESDAAALADAVRAADEVAR